MNGSTVTADFYLLPPRQATVLQIVSQYVETYHRGCPTVVVADALKKERTTIRWHFQELYRKGWLRSPGSPAKPKRSFLQRLDA